MATCEMCGASGTLRKTKVEGARLKLCEDCQEVGEVIDSPTAAGTGSQRSGSGTSASSGTRSRSTSRREPDDELVEDFGSRVKRARESEDLSVGDLASRIKEKDSVIRRIESGKLSPDRGLARKVENALDITLYTEVSEVAAPHEQSSPGSTTIGDVAEVRERE